MYVYYLLAVLLTSLVLIVLATTKWSVHPFMTLLAAAYFVGGAVLLPHSLGLFDGHSLPISWLSLEAAIRYGFGGILSYIGIFIVLSSIIGVNMDKSGATIQIANWILRYLGPKHPILTMSLVGWLVSIPVFCESGFVILSSIRKSITRRTGAPAIAMTVALATGLYASHTLVPPTPGPLAAAGNLGLGNHLDYIILIGLCFSLLATLAGYFWARYMGKKMQVPEDWENEESIIDDLDLLVGTQPNLPSNFLSFSPISIPMVLILLGTLASLPLGIFGNGLFAMALMFFGKPLNALFVGFLCSLLLVSKNTEESVLDMISEGIRQAGPIVLISAAGGAFGAVLKASPIISVLTTNLHNVSLGLLMPFILAAVLKSAQGSSTTAMVTTSAIMAPLLSSLGLDGYMGVVLTVMSTGAGSMIVSHANDSYFWIIVQLSGMDISTAYKAITLGTLIQGLVTMLAVLGVAAFVL